MVRMVSEAIGDGTSVREGSVSQVPVDAQGREWMMDTAAVASIPRGSQLPGPARWDRVGKLVRLAARRAVKQMESRLAQNMRGRNKTVSLPGELRGGGLLLRALRWCGSAGVLDARCQASGNEICPRVLHVLNRRSEHR